VLTWLEILDNLESEVMTNIRFPINKENWPQFLSGVLITLIVLVIFYYGSQANGAYNQSPVKLIVYAFSTQEEVLTQGILPAFEKYWEQETGQELEFEAIFGPSATLAGQINLGSPADIAIFSNMHHMKWLQMGRKVKLDTQPVTIGETPLVIVTRPGNPHDIHRYADLTQADLCLLHAYPPSSGAGEWAILAEYGSALRETGSPGAARAQIEAIWHNVRIIGASARATLDLFEFGAGDALITYEQDALLAQERGVALEIVIPAHTIIAQHVAVTVDENIKPKERPVVQAFMDYLLSESAQRIFASFHLRPINLASDGFPPVSDPFTVEDLGGWSYAYSELVEKYWQTEVEPRLDLGPTPVIVNSED
jgi:ABC-type sulfate transport system substrate-binding protein